MQYFEDFEVTPLHNIMENQPTNVICEGVTYSFDYKGTNRTVYCLGVNSTLFSGIEKESDSYKNFSLNKISNLRTAKHFLTHEPKTGKVENMKFDNLTLEEQLAVANVREPNKWEIKDGKLVKRGENVRLIPCYEPRLITCYEPEREQKHFISIYRGINRTKYKTLDIPAYTDIDKSELKKMINDFLDE